jgi:hypothetical protein
VSARGRAVGARQARISSVACSVVAVALVCRMLAIRPLGARALRVMLPRRQPAGAAIHTRVSERPNVFELKWHASRRWLLCGLRRTHALMQKFLFEAHLGSE